MQTLSYCYYKLYIKEAIHSQCSIFCIQQNLSCLKICRQSFAVVCCHGCYGIALSVKTVYWMAATLTNPWVSWCRWGVKTYAYIFVSLLMRNHWQAPYAPPSVPAYLSVLSVFAAGPPLFWVCCCWNHGSTFQWPVEAGIGGVGFCYKNDLWCYLTLLLSLTPAVDLL